MRYVEPTVALVRCLSGFVNSPVNSTGCAASTHMAGSSYAFNRLLENALSKHPVRPFLVSKDESGMFRLTVRETRYNSQGYPLVTETLQAEEFKTATAAKVHARDNFGAVVGDYAIK